MLFAAPNIISAALVSTSNDTIQQINTRSTKSLVSIDKIIYEIDNSTQTAIVDGAEASITSCTIPTYITVDNIRYRINKINHRAFYNHQSLTSVVILSSAVIIESSAFENCKKLQSVLLSNYIKEIKPLAFKNCVSLKSITIPKSVKTIGHSAFQGCKSLRSVNMSNSVKIIEEYAFADCDSLSSIKLSDNITVINNHLFSGCKSLKTLSLPHSVQKIGIYAFYKTALESIDLPNLVQSIDDNAFSSCTSLTSIKLPNSLVSIGSDAFTKCSSLTEAVIPNSVTSIGSRAFQDCKELTSVTLPNALTSIKYELFSRCHKLRSIIIPESVTVIENRAFSSCNNLVSVNLSNSIKRIQQSAFEYCYRLTQLTIPQSINYIESYAFTNCYDLHSVTFLSDTPLSYNSSWFSNCFIDYFYVPEEALQKYKAAKWPIDYLEPIRTTTKSFLINDAATDIYAEPVEKFCDTLKYIRNFNETTWQALYVPFEIPFDEISANFDIAKLNNMHQFDDNEDDTFDRWSLEVLHLKTGDIVKANTPYVIRPKKTGLQMITLQDVTLQPAKESHLDCSSTEYKYVFTGTYNGLHDGEMAANHYYALDETGKLVYTTNPEESLGGYRWYLSIAKRDHTMDSTNILPTSIKIIEENDGNITNINQIDSSYSNNKKLSDKIYDLNGHIVSTNGKLDKLPKGIYLQNGKKIIK